MPVQALMLLSIAILQVSCPSFVKRLGILASYEIPLRIGGRQERSTVRNEIKLKLLNSWHWQSPVSCCGRLNFLLRANLSLCFASMLPTVTMRCIGTLG